jgi:hypothetical protein
LSAAWRLKKGTKKRPNMVQKPYLVAHQVTPIMKQTILIKVRAYKKNNHIHMPGMQKTIFLGKLRGWAKGLIMESHQVGFRT